MFNLWEKDKDYEISLLQSENKKLMKENAHLLAEVEAFQDCRKEYMQQIEQLKKATDDCAKLKTRFEKIEKDYLKELEKLQK